MKISQELFKVFKKIKKHIVSVSHWHSYHYAKLNVFWAATAFQYSADHKKKYKITVLFQYVSMLSYTNLQKSLFQNTLLADIPYPILKNEAFLKS